jgi:hypothetical protein
MYNVGSNVDRIIFKRINVHHGRVGHTGELATCAKPPPNTTLQRNASTQPTRINSKRGSDTACASSSETRRDSLSVTRCNNLQYHPKQS